MGSQSTDTDARASVGRPFAICNGAVWLMPSNEDREGGGIRLRQKRFRRSAATILSRAKQTRISLIPAPICMLSLVFGRPGLLESPPKAARRPPGNPPAETALIPSVRTTTWNPGLNAVGGIPHRTTVCATVDASTYADGAIEASVGIQRAINACPMGQVVQLSAGTFLVSHLILINKGITLRGAGPQATILRKSNGAVAGVDHGETDSQPIIIIGPNRWPKIADATSQNLIADGNKGSYSITIGNIGKFVPGQFVLVDADDYSSASWTALPNRNGTPTDVQIFVVRSYGLYAPYPRTRG
jgi:hypothetical protein